MSFALAPRRLLLGALIVLLFGVAALAATSPSGQAVSMRPVAALAGGDGYWVAGVDGTVAAFGDVASHGSLDRAPNKPIVGIAPTASGQGYWLVASDGGMFTFGDAGFHGSTGHLSLAKPIVGGAMAASGTGYWFVGGDGGVFAFGHPGFLGSAVGKVGRGAAAMAASPRYVVNTVPVATADSVTTAEDRAVTIDVLANDRGLVDGGLTVGIDSPGARGAAAVSGTTITCTPSANLSGTDTFRYRVTDIDGDWSVGTVTVSVTAVNDPPAFASFSSAGANPAIDEDTSHDVDLSVRDPDHSADTLSFSFTSSNPALVPATPAGRTLTGSGSSRTLTLQPAANQSGTATITVKATDGAGASGQTTVNLTVTPLNDAPTVTAIADQTIDEDTATAVLDFTIAVLDFTLADLTVSAASDNQPLVANGGIALGGSGANRTVTVTPVADAHGTAPVAVSVSDGTATGSEPFAVNVTPVDDQPVAANDTASMNEDAAPLNVSVLANDNGIGDAPLTLTITAQPDPAAGTAAVNLDNTVRFTPVTDFNGTATFTYRVTDGDAATGDFDEATVTVTVNPTNDGPSITIVPTSASTAEDTATAVDFTVADPDHDPLFLTLSATSSDASKVALATSGIGANRTITVTPAANAVTSTPVTITVTVADPDNATATDSFFGTDSFTFRTKDSATPQQSSGVATVSITVTAVNDMPTITDIVGQTINEDTATGALSFTMTDVETAAGLLQVSGSSSPELVEPVTGYAFSGSGGSRQVTITPKLNAHGTTTITITVTDTDGGQATDTFTLTVTSVNDAPVANADTANAVVNGPTVTIAVQANDTDPDHDTSQLTVSNPTGATRGAVTCTASECQYTPIAGLLVPGTDTFTYTITDPGGLAHTATVTVVIGLRYL